MTVWKNERPTWCPHKERCECFRRNQDSTCVGKLPEPIYHDETPNTHRVCFGPGTEAAPISFDTYEGDCDGMRYLMDAIDGKETSWRSRRRRESVERIEESSRN